MSQRELERCLKALDIIVVIACIGVMLAIVPQRCLALATANPQMAYLVPCGWTLIAVAAIPIVTVGVLAWRMFSDIGNDDSFSSQNVVRLVRIGYLACAEAVLFTLVIIALGLIGALAEGLLAVLFMAVIICGGLGVVAFSLSHFTARVAEIKAENDLTV